MLPAAKTASTIREAAAAARAGRKFEARELLDELLQSEPENETAWLWRAAVSEDTREAIHALETVLRLNPGNDQAKTALESHYRVLRKAEEAGRAAEAKVMEAKAGAGGGVACPVVAEAAGPMFVVPERPAGVKPVALPPSRPAPQGWQCPICQTRAEGPLVECGHCRSLVDLSDVDAIARHGGVDERLVAAFMQRGLAALRTKHSAETYWQLALGYLNLKASNEALPFLEVLLRGRPQDALLSGAVAAIKRRKLILAVDDSATIRKILSLTLERALYRVALAATGTEALQKLEHIHPDLVLLDITMPGMDGYQVCKEIRGKSQFRGLPVLMLSGKDGFFDKVKGRMAGATSYLTKPFEPPVLLESIAAALR